MSPRVIQLPLSGGDRKHYVRELKWAQQEHPRLIDRLIDAYNAAHRVACEEWTMRQFIGGPADPSPQLGAAISAGCTLLRVECRACGHGCDVNLRDLIWPEKSPVHTLSVKANGKPGPLRCARCNANRPNLVGLYDPTPGPRGRSSAGRST